MPKLVTYPQPWYGNRETCPPDWDFVDWLAMLGREGDTIFHMGTGAHHYVGSSAIALRSYVLGLTNNVEEIVQYIDWAINNPIAAQYYQVLFGDVQNLAPKLLPELDVACLFHLGESTAEDEEQRSEYSAYNPIDTLDAIAGNVRSGGYVALYPGSEAWGRVGEKAEAYLRTRYYTVHDWKSIRLYHKDF